MSANDTPTLRAAASAWYDAQGWDTRLPPHPLDPVHDLVMAIRAERAAATPPTTTVWGYADSQEAEAWSTPYSTREEAIAAGLADSELADGEVWVVSGERCDPGDLVPTAFSVIEDMSDTAAGEGWPDGGCDDVLRVDTSKEALDTLTALLTGWARRWIRTEAWRVAGAPVRVRAAVDAETERSDEG